MVERERRERGKQREREKKKPTTCLKSRVCREITSHEPCGEVYIRNMLS